MATTERDYYDVLGLSRNADDREIKSAFRRLARELHPDVSAEPDAEQRFKEVVEAYEVLSKTETRRLYDQYGHAGLRRGGFQPGHFDFGNLSDLFAAFFGDDIFGAMGGRRQSRGADVAAEVEIELVEAAQGTKREISFEVATACTACGGSGVEPGTEVSKCPTCSGAGVVQQLSRTVFGDVVRSSTCPDCSGRGHIIEHPCEECAGGGQTLERRTLDVDIPKGIHDGQRIRMSGEGHAGSLGGRAGDIYVLVRVRSDPRFSREGNDLFSTVDLTMTQAALGTRVTVPTIDGEHELEFPAGTQPGELRVLKGEGMPVLQGFGRGDHRILVNVLIPRQLDDDAKRLLQEFEARSGAATYEVEESFFGKLKSAFR
jgi:molecular chaperone DnaJ